MSLLLIAKNRDLEPLKDALLSVDLNLDVEIWPRVEKKERVTFAVSWNHPEKVLLNYPNLKVVSSLGAGVDHLLKDLSIDENVALTRVVVPSLKDQMAEYVLNSVQNYRFNTARYVDQKREGFWSTHDVVPKSDCVIGVMGLGEMGQAVASSLIVNRYSVVGWSRTKKDVNTFESFAADELDEFLDRTNILVCLLPLTEETDGILDLELFKKLKKPAYLINVARGQHLIEEDLIYALDTGVLEGATLDVFEEEPLPANHLFWNRPKIMITPHVASITDPKEAATLIVENYKRSLSGMDLLFEVDRTRGY
ncbi:MAG: glyoxylate/hydroxypyruvate reductase A [bacterium]|nr:glyoxylate/hydroxypyruvate reductase A [bacterium]